MGDRASAERACKDPNPIIDGRKANVNLAILGAKPRGNLTPGNLKTSIRTKKQKIKKNQTKKCFLYLSICKCFGSSRSRKNYYYSLNYYYIFIISITVNNNCFRFWAVLTCAVLSLSLMYTLYTRWVYAMCIQHIHHTSYSISNACDNRVHRSSVLLNYLVVLYALVVVCCTFLLFVPLAGCERRFAFHYNISVDDGGFVEPLFIENETKVKNKYACEI